MARFAGSIAPALDAYRRALDAGVDRQVALDVALAKLRVSYPGRDESTLRSWLVQGLAEQRRERANEFPTFGFHGSGTEKR